MPEAKSEVGETEEVVLPICPRGAVRAEGEW